MSLEWFASWLEKSADSFGSFDRRAHIEAEIKNSLWHELVSKPDQHVSFIFYGNMCVFVRLSQRRYTINEVAWRKGSDYVQD